MNEPPLESGGRDEILARFLLAYSDAADKNAVLAEHCRDHPDLAAEFRELAAADDLMRWARRPDAEQPERLGEFRIVRRLESGGMGVIYEAVQEPLRRRVAVKTIRRGRMSPIAQARFQREQKVLASLHQTHIVPIHTAGQEGPLQYFAMPFIEGAALHHVIRSLRQECSSRPGGKAPSLARLVERRTKDGDKAAETPAEAGRGGDAATAAGGKLALSMEYFRSTAQVLVDAAEALQHAHEAGVLHRDVKPSNLMVDRLGHCWIIDFGLAGYLAGDDGAAPKPDESDPGVEAVTASGVLGTPQYMAPEQWSGGKPDARTDVWGLGATLYEMLTLRRAFDGSTHQETMKKALSAEPTAPTKLVRRMPSDLAAVCLKALQKDPKYRYQTAGQFAADLRCWLRDEPTTARPGLFRRIWLWAVRNKGWAAAVVLAFLASVGVVAAEMQAMQERATLSMADLDNQKLQLLRLAPHLNGWSDRGWDLVRRAAAMRKDDALRDQAAAVLVGVDGRMIKDFGGQFDASSVAFDADGKRLLIGGSSAQARLPHKEAKLWDGSINPPLDSGLAGAGPVAFRPEGAPLQLVPDPMNRLRLILWDAAGRREVRAFEVPSTGDPEALTADKYPRLAMTADAVLVAASVTLGDGTGRVVVWDAGVGKVVRQIDPGGRKISAVAVAPDGSCLADGEEDGTVTVWPLPEGGPIALPSAGRTLVNGLAFGRSPRRPEGGPPDRRSWLLAAGDAGGTATVWDLDRIASQTYCHGSSYDVYVVAFSPDGATLASAGRYDVRLWDIATGRLLVTLGNGDFMTGLAFSPDGATLAASSESVFGKEGGVRVWGLEAGRGMRTLRGLSSQVSKVCLSADGRLAAALSHDWQVGVWDLQTGRLVRLLAVPNGVVADNAGLALSPDGRRFAFAAGTEARMWDLTTGKEEQSWKLPPALQDNMAFDPSGQKLLLIRVETADGVHPPYSSSSPRDYPRVCPIRDLLGRKPLEPIARIDYFNWAVDWIRLGRDGGWVVVRGFHGAAGEETVFKVFEGPTGKEVWSQAPSKAVADMTFDATGTVLAVAAEGGAPASLLELPSRRQIGYAAHLYGCMSPGAKWSAQSPDNGFGFSLFRADAEAPVVTLGIDSRFVCVQPQFSTDGNILAWGNADGSVSVCNLAEVQSRLAGVGLGW